MGTAADSAEGESLHPRHFVLRQTDSKQISDERSMSGLLIKGYKETKIRRGIRAQCVRSWGQGSAKETDGMTSQEGRTEMTKQIDSQVDSR